MVPVRSKSKTQILFLSLLILLLAGVVMFAAPWKSLAADETADEVAAVDEEARGKAVGDETIGDETIGDETIGDEALLEEVAATEAVTEEAEPQAGGYGLWIAGLEINEENCWNIVGALNQSAANPPIVYGQAFYDASINTLYFGDFETVSGGVWTGWTGTVPGIGNAMCAIYCTHDLTIVINGDENNIKAAAPAADNCSSIGICVAGDLTIKSPSYYDEFSLSVSDVPSGISGCGTYGIYANNLVLDGSWGNVSAGAPSSGSPSYGVYATKSIKPGFDGWLMARGYQRAFNRKPVFDSQYYPQAWAGDRADSASNWSTVDPFSYGFTDTGVEIGSDYSLKRLAGADRYATGAAIVDTATGFGSSSPDFVILATGRDYPDALCASALAGLADAPILMVEPNKLPAATATALKRLHPNTIIVVGGTGAVSDGVLQAACNLTGVTSTYRFAGANRYETGLKIYEAGGDEWGDTCIIATGGNFADALSISPYAFASCTPIFLADAKTHKLNDQTVEAVQGEFSKVIIVGGTGVVSDDVVGQLGATSMVRLAGNSRYDTSLAIATWELKDYESGQYEFGPEITMTMDAVSVATGEGFADALAGGVLCGVKRSPLLLVNGKNYAGAASLLDSYKEYYYRGYVFGGTGAVSAAVKSQLDKAVQFE